MNENIVLIIHVFYCIVIRCDVQFGISRYPYNLMDGEKLSEENKISFMIKCPKQTFPKK